MKTHLQEVETNIRNEETTKRIEEEISKKVEEALNIDEVKTEMKTRIEGQRN